MKKNLYLLLFVVLLAAAAFFIWNKNTSGSLADDALADFAIEDTSSITKIFITDAQGRAVTLERQPDTKLWKLDGKYYAREDAVTLLLKTFKRMRVRSSVPHKAKENMLKVMAGGGRKVEVYTGGDEPAKIYYVGTATPDHTGTVMVLEIPDIGRSPEPYIVYMEGFTGYLTTRFHADEEDWRYTGIFEYPKLEFKKVEVIFSQDKSLGFSINYEGENNLKLLDGNGISIPRFDTLMVKNYLLLYKKVHFETWNSYMNQASEDSLLKTTPAFSLMVTTNNDEKKKVDLYLKRAIKEAYDGNGNLLPVDQESFYGVPFDREVVLCQRFVFDPLLVPVDVFLAYPAQ